MMSANRTLPSALPLFMPVVPPISPLATSMPPSAPLKMRITVDPNMKVSEDDPTLDIDLVDGVRSPTPTKAGFIAFFACLGFAYFMAIVATLAVTGSPVVTLLHQLRSAI